MELVHDGTEKTVTITPKEGKSPGAITVYYNGSTDPKPKDIGSYTVTFDVAKAAGWNAAAGLSAGTLEIVTAGTPTLSDYTITGLGVQIADGTAKTVSAAPKAGASPGVVTVLYGGSKSTTAPSAAGSYAITLQVAAAAGFYAAELDAGTMEIIAPLMTMTTTKAGEATITLRGTGTAAIYWGDSPTPDTKTLSPSSDNIYKHTYTASGNKTIAIVSEGSVTYLACSSNQLNALDVSKNTALTFLSCSSNQLSTLDVSKNTWLTTLYCSSNQLSALDVSKNTRLKTLSCLGNQLSALDVSKNTALTFLMCESNRLSAFDISKNTALTYLNCGVNQLSVLDVSKNTALTQLDCHSNKLEADALNALFGTLHSNSGTKTIYIGFNPGTGTCDRTIATAKGWTIP